VDKTCLMVLERTLHLFRRPDLLRQEHPTYRMICTPVGALRGRAKTLADALAKAVPGLTASVEHSSAYLGSGSLPTKALPSAMVSVSVPGLSASELARRLRLDEACIFSRIEDDLVRLDMRTLTDEQVPGIVAAFGRIALGTGVQTAHSREQRT
jgi:L-seryl-tRNA(Ser) seleniumtransferase